jgi:hypothetical protein
VGDLGDSLNGVGAFLHIGEVGAYTASVREGTDDVKHEIELRHTLCSDTRFILAGYSQGAQAVGDALQRMPEEDQALVTAAVFFGDPYRNSKSWSDRGHNHRYGVLGVRDEYPESMEGHVFSYCRGRDPICGGQSKFHILGESGDHYYLDVKHFRGFADHGKYKSSGDTTDAAKNIYAHLGFTPLPFDNDPLDLAFAITRPGRCTRRWTSSNLRSRRWSA